MKDEAKRLIEARIAAGYPDATAAARALDMKPPTYLGHENGSRGFTRTSAIKYARKFGVSLEWLLTGRGSTKPTRSTTAPERRTTPLVGYVSAGAQAHFFSDQGEIDRVATPDGSSENTVAVEIRGESLGSIFDRWLVYYNNVHRPVTSDLVGKLCVVGLEDGRILVKKIQRSKTRGLFHLLSNTEEPILDVPLEWAAKVEIMTPR